MKRQVIIEFETSEELEQYDPHYKGNNGAVNIANEMIIMAVLQHQLTIIEQAIVLAKNPTSDNEQFIHHLTRFKQAVRSIKVKGFVDTNTHKIHYNE